jgi:hypothetical protein
MRSSSLLYDAAAKIALADNEEFETHEPDKNGKTLPSRRNEKEASASIVMDDS